jgi:hypothetical protein
MAFQSPPPFQNVKLLPTKRIVAGGVGMGVVLQQAVMERAARMNRSLMG